MGAKRTDACQAEIVEKLRAIGATIKDVHIVKNFCDILCGYKGKDYKFEVKSPGGKLTKGEWDFHQSWKGAPTYIVHSFEEAYDILTEDE